MDTQQLLTLQKLAREKSFSRASRELGISQPTATMRIKALEDELGETLILRTGQKAVLTPAGEIFLSHVDRALKVLQSAVDRISAGPDGNFLAIAGTPSFNTFVLPEILQEFRVLHPDIQWQIYTDGTENILKMIADGIIDIGLVRGMVPNSTVSSFPLFFEKFLLILPNNHPLALKESVSLPDLQNEPIVFYRRNSDTWGEIEKRFLAAGVQPKITMELNHTVTVKQMLLAGEGVAFLPELTVKNELETGLLTAGRIEGPPILRPISAVIPQWELPETANSFLLFLKSRFVLGDHDGY
ncbi:LysR family transcriptional regulator [Effusibacillus lacus]|uniref:HTH lysR-type domain-containing protein n=1 Tax=Effusibacillus lacus TaxID=1348429 RepID=A0A292YKA9_9BACL|nr:LysR family transcriptional regulator [Effusibacillus lacus]TCS76616.1 LysR family transcriptional regulator [Effusibacillus lacus]GAX90368.1 hypothetical protein EFBL_1994 [Effusibacillus lacus]